MVYTENSPQYIASLSNRFTFYFKIYYVVYNVTYILNILDTYILI